MSDDQTYLTREHLETSKQRARVYREWVYLIIACLVALTAVWALYSWKKGNDMAGALNARAMGILDKLDAKVTAVDINKLTDVADSTKARIDALADTQAELNRLIASTERNTTKLSNAATARIEQIGENLTSLKGVTDKAGLAIASITTATNTLMDKYGLTADEAAKAIKLASEKTGKSIDELNKQISNPKWGEAADNLVKTTADVDALASNLNATVLDFHTDLHDTMKQMPHIMAQVDKTATNISKFSKISIIAGIISNLANGFIPGLLH